VMMHYAANPEGEERAQPAKGRAAKSKRAARATS